MITSDADAYNIILMQISSNNISSKEKEILSLIALLMKDYSFVENQTYPRPFHPNPSQRKDAYFTLIAIILSLRTTLENEKRAVNAFLTRFKSIDEVAISNIEDIKNVILCAGMPQKKAKTILEITNYIISNYSGDINNVNVGSIVDIREKLLNFPGIGEKSADCMLELAFNLPSIVVDTNVFRVISRIYFSNENMNFSKKDDILKVKNFLEENISNNYRIFQIVHTILLLHGKHICRAKPYCDKCKISNTCNYCRNKVKNTQLSLFL